MRGARLATAVAAWAGVAGLTPPVRAATNEPLELTWLAPEPSDCPDRAQVLESIRRYIGADVAPGYRPIEAVATIRRREHAELELVLNTFDGTARGERVFRDTSCRSIADAAVVVLAWMIDPDGMAARSAPPSSAEPELPIREPTEQRGVAVPASPPVAWIPYVGAGASTDWGTLPKLGLGSHLRVGVVVERFRLEVRGRYWASMRKTLPAQENGAVPGATFKLWDVGLDACLDILSARAMTHVGLAFCLGPEVEVLKGVGFGVTVPAEGTKAWLALAASFAGRFRVAAPLLVVFGAGGSLPFYRERFALRGVGEIHRPSLVAARAQLGLEVEL